MERWAPVLVLVPFLAAILSPLPLLLLLTGTGLLLEDRVPAIVTTYCLLPDANFQAKETSDVPVFGFVLAVEVGRCARVNPFRRWRHPGDIAPIIYSWISI